MNRRGLIVLLCSAMLAPADVARAQQSAVPVIGFLSNGSPTDSVALLALAKFREGLQEAGYTEGQNVIFEYRYAEGHNSRLPALAAELVARNVNVLVAGSWPGAQAAKNATSSIPIVVGVGVDPVGTGLVGNLARPEGNLTGVTIFGPRLNVKRLELLSELVPAARKIVFLMNQNNPGNAKSIEQYGGRLEEAAQASGIELRRIAVGNTEEIDTMFASLAEEGGAGLLVGADPLFYRSKDQIVALAARYRIPTIYDHRMYADAGGLISYGAKWERTLGSYAGRILAGAKPADLPFQMPDKFELVFNRKTAEALGITLPLILETQADEIIE